MDHEPNDQVPQPAYPDALIPESDSSGNDTDSAIGGVSYASSTTSADSEIFSLEEQFGRTYHGYKAGKYLLPNDEQERDRLDLQHMLFLLTVDQHLHLAPLQDPRACLDVATGTGIWAMDFAEKYPNCRVIGTDLSAIQSNFVPLNCEFQIHDAEDSWNFSRTFDYIHARAILSCFNDHRAFIQNAFNNLEPGGYLEIQDGLFPFQFLDPQPSAEHPAKAWLDNTVAATQVMGRTWNNAQHYATWMQEIGFEDVVERRFYWPCGPWAKGDKMKKLGIYFHEDLKHAVEGICLKLFTNFLKWDEQRVRDFIPKVLASFNGAYGKLRMYETVIFVFGRKPLSR